MIFPTYSTRAMRGEFVQCYGRFTHDKPALLRELYRRLTGDSSSSDNATEAEVDEQVSQLLDSEDPNLIWDLREQPRKTGNVWRILRRMQDIH